MTLIPKESRYDIALDCVHCGLCLPVCPTYLHLGDEADSPRGRIYLMRAHEEERQALTPGFLEHLDRCLVCRACETACPSGVRFGAMMEDFRALARAAERTPGTDGRAASRRRARLGSFVLDRIVPDRSRLHQVANVLRVVQQLRLDRWAARTGLLRALGLGAVASLAPRVPPASARARWPVVLPAYGARRARVHFLRGCVTPELLPEMQQASIEVLRWNGCEVVTPDAQVCCGALHFHAGAAARGQELLERNLEAFDPNDADALVVNAAGCGSTLKEYGALAAPDPEAAIAAATLSARVRDIHEFLADLGLVPPTQRLALRVAYDDPCHLLHGQRIAAAPRALLAAIPGSTLVPLRDADRCCGSAGIYNLTQPDLANAILQEKLLAIAESECEVVATGNPGCILQIRGGIERAAATDSRLRGVRVHHPMELLARAYAAP